ncbi:MAG TPA: hypothetical protein VMW03_02800 [Candidatus Krumholzibacteriaceae bacterium]|nr:hypothetical protein [Candidatus Krumholzibacteriaceae bacterium]
MTKTSSNTKGLSVQGKTRKAVAEFIENLLDRKFTDAERSLEAVKDCSFSDEEYKAGYVNALEGLLLTVRSGDERDFLNRNQFTPENLKDYRSKFKGFASSPIRTSWDSGYFDAWADLMQYKYNVER